MKKHPEKYLNAARIKNAAPGRHADGNGLYLFVDDSGAKRWVLRTVIKGKRSELGLGGLLLVSLAEAREEAARLRKIARRGGDPLAERRQERLTLPTFEKAAHEVHEAHSATFRNIKHKADWINSLSMYVFPVFGKRQINNVESKDILDALIPIWNQKPETARRVKQRIKIVFDYSVARGWVLSNPVDKIKRALPKHTSKQEHFPALPYSQVPEFIEALRNANVYLAIRLALEFLILTATRTSEVMLAKWSEMDFESTTWTIPASRMKAKQEHRVPLSGRCIEILERMKEISHGDYVFPGRRAGKPLSNMAFLMTLRRMNRSDITTHGFRSSFRDWAEERTNTQRSVIEAALAHQVENKVEAAYLRTTLFEKRRDLMNRWDSFCIVKPTEKVVRIREG